MPLAKLHHFWITQSDLSANVDKALVYFNLNSKDWMVNKNGFVAVDQNGNDYMYPLPKFDWVGKHLFANQIDIKVSKN